MPKNTCQVVGEELRVEVFGVVDDNAARELLASVKRVLLEKPVKLASIITNGVADCSESARKILVDLQREIGARGRRSVWIDERSRFRGLALWVMHLAADQNCKAVSSADQARAWFESKDLREAAAQRRAVGQ